MIAILLSTYNGEIYLSEQIDSIINQTNQLWQLYIRDDGSKDKTTSIILEYVNKYPEKVFYKVDEKGNVGVKSSFEILLQHTEADYYMFCDQDDVWLPNKVELTLRRMQQIEEEFPSFPLLVHTDLCVVNQHLQEIAPSFWEYSDILPHIIDKEIGYMAIVNSITGCTTMINNKAKEISLPFPIQSIMHDAWIGLCCIKNGKLDYITQATILYRQHSNNAVGAKQINKNLLYKLKEIYKIFSANKQQYLQVNQIQSLSLWQYINYKLKYRNLIKK